MARQLLPLDKEDHDLVILALAVLSLESPGFAHALRKVAHDVFDAETLFNDFRVYRGGRPVDRERV